MLSFKNQSGDTLIEVLLAITVFSLVAVGSITIMNQGANAAQRAIEITHVRHQIDSQAEALRAAHQAYATKTEDSDRRASVWQAIADLPDTSARDINQVCSTEVPDSSVFGSAFAMDPMQVRIVSSIKPAADPDAELYSQFLDGESHSLWIEKSTIPANGRVPGSHTFSIRACWFGPGISTPMQLSTIVRLHQYGI